MQKKRIKKGAFRDLIFIFIFDEKDRVRKIDIEEGNLQGEKEINGLLSSYFLGDDDFLKIPFYIHDNYSPFFYKVLYSTRSIRRGQTVSYGELARMAGYDKNYAKAVGAVLRKNPLPLIFPCHRIIMSSGKYGGFGGKEGITIKERLLRWERGALL